MIKKMKELKVGERAVIEAVEQKSCDGCFFDHDDTCVVTQPIMIGQTDSNVNQKTVLMARV